MFDFNKLKALFSGLKKTGGEKGAAGDFRDTTTRAAVDAIVSEIVERIPKKYIVAMSKHQARLISVAAVLIGYLFRKVTPFGPFGDNIITDLAQATANRIMEEYEDEIIADPKKIKDFQLRKTKLILIAKILLNSASHAKDLSAEKLLYIFNEMMEETNEENHNELIDTLAGFSKNELIEFMKCSKEEKKRLFSYLFTKIPENKEEPSRDLDGLKEWFNDAKKSLDSVFLKTDDFFQLLDERCSPDGPIGKLSKSFRERAQEFYNKTKLEKGKK